MLILGLLLVLVGALILLVGIVEATGDVLVFGNDLTAATVVVLGAVAGAAVVAGLVATRSGAHRSLRRRRETRLLTERSARLEQAEAGRTEPERPPADDRRADPGP